jgi:hypothetical protein
VRDRALVATPAADRPRSEWTDDDVCPELALPAFGTVRPPLATQHSIRCMRQKEKPH